MKMIPIMSACIENTGQLLKYSRMMPAKKQEIHAIRIYSGLKSMMAQLNPFDGEISDQP